MPGLLLPPACLPARPSISSLFLGKYTATHAPHPTLTSFEIFFHLPRPLKLQSSTALTEVTILTILAVVGLVVAPLLAVHAAAPPPYLGKLK